MASKWPRVRISEVCELIVDCVNKTAPKSEFPTEFKMLRTPNVKNGRVDTSNCFYVTEDTYLKWTRRATVNRNDVLLTREAPLGEVGIVKSEEKLFLGQRLMQYRADQTKLDPDFLAYSFLSPDLQHQFRMHEGSGSVVSHIRVGDCSKFEINLPPLTTQKSIAKILGELDQRIELNRKTNQTLEQMAQTLFKSWFVDFDPVVDNALAAGKPIPDELLHRVEVRKKAHALADFQPLPEHIRNLFPSEFEQTGEPTVGINGWVPKGWQVTNMHQMVETVSKTYNLKEVDEVIFLNTSDIESGQVLHNEYSQTIGLPGQAKKTIKKGDILYSEIRPQNKRYAFVDFDAEEYVVSTKLMVLRAKEGIEPLLPYFLLTQEETVNELQRVAEHRSGTFPQITYKELSKVLTVLPREAELVTLFVEQYLKPSYAKKASLTQQNTQLTKIRDTLLPKLISGEIQLDSSGSSSINQEAEVQGV